MAATTIASPTALLSSGYFDRLQRSLRGWLLVRRTERQLAELSPRQLADIGLDAPRLPRAYRQAMLNGTMLG